MSRRAITLQIVDDALAEIGAIEAILRTSGPPGLGQSTLPDLSRRFHAVAQAATGRPEFAPVQVLAALAEKVTDGADRRVLPMDRELELAQHAADVLSLMLRDLGHRLLGRRGADVAPAAAALRERLEQALLTGSRR
jgi:hypothetical protein